MQFLRITKPSDQPLLEMRHQTGPADHPNLIDLLPRKAVSPAAHAGLATIHILQKKITQPRAVFDDVVGLAAQPLLPTKSI